LSTTITATSRVRTTPRTCALGTQTAPSSTTTRANPTSRTYALVDDYQLECKHTQGSMMEWRNASEFALVYEGARALRRIQVSVISGIIILTTWTLDGLAYGSLYPNLPRTVPQLPHTCPILRRLILGSPRAC
jgi:hypothetical protein